MPTYQLKLKLLSETTFGRGDGQAGVVDLEVQHDAFGRPFWSGRAVKGVLVNECADILDMLSGSADYAEWCEAARWLFGGPGSGMGQGSNLSFGEAHLPDDLHRFFERQFQQQVNPLLDDPRLEDEAARRALVAREQERYRKLLLRSISADRSQTALGEDGTAKEHSLRSQRVLMPGLTLVADLHFYDEPQARHRGLLAACVKALHSGGSRRNRGRGDIEASLLADGEEITSWFQHDFAAEVRK